MVHTDVISRVLVLLSFGLNVTPVQMSLRGIQVEKSVINPSGLFSLVKKML